jgi:hypothetical protein
MLSWGSPYINISILPTNSPSQCLAPSFMPIRPYPYPSSRLRPDAHATTNRWWRVRGQNGDTVTRLFPQADVSAKDKEGKPERQGDVRFRSIGRTNIGTSALRTGGSKSLDWHMASPIKTTAAAANLIAPHTSPLPPLLHAPPSSSVPPGERSSKRRRELGSSWTAGDAG